MTLQNANAWASLTEKPDEDAGAAAAREDAAAGEGGDPAAAAAGGSGDGDGEKGEGEGEEDEDNLWAEFQTREEQQHARVRGGFAWRLIRLPWGATGVHDNLLLPTAGHAGISVLVLYQRCHGHFNAHVLWLLQCWTQMHSVQLIIWSLP